MFLPTQKPGNPAGLASPDYGILSRSRFYKKKIIAVLLLVIGFAAFNLFRTRSISVVGVGSETVEANKAMVSFVFAVSDPSRETAQLKGDTEFNSLLTRIAEFSPSQVQRITSQVRIQQIQGQDGTMSAVYVYSSGGQITINGANSTQNLVKILNSGNSRVLETRYIPENEEVVQEQVQGKALENARGKAGQIAKAAGGRIGKILLVTEQGGNAGTGTSVTSVPIQKDQQTAAASNQVQIQSVLTVTFELKPFWMLF